MSRDARFLIDTWSDPTHPPEARLLDRKGAQLAVLQPNALDEGHPYAPYRALHQAPTYGTVKSPDGQTLHYGYVTPPGFDPARRYPVILRYYGGPGRQFVTRAWMTGVNTGLTDLLTQYWAQQGYVVFALDNRGSGGRGQKFTEALYHHLGGVEVEDQLKGINWLKTQPFVDAGRVGVFGWSYGGYMTLMLLGQSPGTFKAGVAGAPVTDYRLYDTHYTERYMGTPQENPEGYRRSNVLTYAGNIRDRLLIIHGMADDNVLFTNTTLLIPALVASGQPFEVVPYPGSKHAALSFRDTGIHGWRTILDFFDRNL